MMIFPSDPPTSNDLMIAVDILRDYAVDHESVTPTTPETAAAALKVAGALEILAPFAQKMEENPGNLLPMIELLLQAQSTEGSGHAASSKDSTEG